MPCVNTCKCDRGYIRDAVYDEDAQKVIPRDYICQRCQGDPCMDCAYGDGCV